VPIIKSAGVLHFGSELRDLINGSMIRLYGADNPDALRGPYLDGVVLDEFADMKPEVWYEVVRPMLADRQGFALTNSRAKREASSTMTVRTPLSSMRLSSSAKPGRVSIGSAPPRCGRSTVMHLSSRKAGLTHGSPAR
jgi:hypothetical protein